jgi:ubiquinone/menaquinone biosynthesis C-methylase UbiE
MESIVRANGPVPFAAQVSKPIQKKGLVSRIRSLRVRNRPHAAVALGTPAADSATLSSQPHLNSVQPREMLKAEVQSFWQKSPCDSWFTAEEQGTPAFYRTLDEHRYQVHPQLASAVEFEKSKGKRILEIGCGCGSEAERFARAGASYTAVDLTNAAVNITQRRFQLAGLKGNFTQGDAENLPFADDSFDIVYSHGVLHHTPDTPRTIREVHRVLAPGGRAVIMLYNQNSFNYQVNLSVVRRLRARLLTTEFGIRLACKLWSESEQEMRRHAAILRQDPQAYLDRQSMLNRNTDGPDNPLSQVFSRESGSNLFWQFLNVRTKIMFWNPNYLPLLGRFLPKATENWLASHWGWHLWIYADKAREKRGVERQPGSSREEIGSQLPAEALAA